MHVRQINAFGDTTGVTIEGNLEKFDSYWVRNQKFKALVFDEGDENDFQIEHKTITPDSKIFFSKTCSFPSLLLGRLQKEHPEIKLKRVTKPEKADFIVYDHSKFTDHFRILITNDLTFADIEAIDKKGLIGKDLMDSFRDRHKNFPDVPYVLMIREYRDILAQMQSKMEEQLGYKLQQIIIPDNADAALEYYNNRSKLITTRNLIEYIYSFIPPTSKEEVMQLLDYMKSGDATTREMVVNSLQYMNLSQVMYPVMSWFNLNLREYEFGNTSAWKYLYYVLDANPSKLTSYTCTRRVMEVVNTILKNSLNATTLDEYKDDVIANVYMRFNRDTPDLIRDLKDIGYTIKIEKCDENGETGTSDTTVEGSGC